METASSILTIQEVAQILRCSKAHVQNVLSRRGAGSMKGARRKEVGM